MSKILKVRMVDKFTDLNLENYDGESEIFDCSRCSLMMSIIDNRLSSFFASSQTK